MESAPVASANHTRHSLAGCIAAVRHHAFLCTPDLDFARSDFSSLLLKSGMHVSDTTVKNAKTGGILSFTGRI